MRQYTLEIYKPAWPSTGTLARIHTGDFEENRDTLSPSMVSTYQVTASNKREAHKKARTMLAPDIKLER